MKKLVTEQTIKDFVVGHGTGYPFPIDKDTLITPLARDKAKSLGLTFANSDEAGSQPLCHKEVSPQPAEAVTQKETPSAECKMTYDRQLIVETIIKVLEERGILGKILD